MQYFENTATSYTIEQDDYIVADLIGNTNTGSAPRIDIKYCGDNYGGCPADIAQNISNYEVSGGTWSKSVSPSGSGDELLVFEISGDVPPTNTKLLQLNDVSFNVGTDSASVEEVVVSTGTYSTSQIY